MKIYRVRFEDTGFHIHISTVDESIEVDFYKFMLLCNESSLLKNWENRNAFCLNVMDILTILDMEEAKKLKNKNLDCCTKCLD